METNRIDLAFALAKSNQAKSTSNASGGAFADMLLGAMGQKSSIVGADKSQVKPAETLTPRRRFDDYRPYHYDSRDDADGRVDRRVDNSQARTRQSSDDMSVNPGRNSQQQTDAAAHHNRAAHTAASSEKCATDVAEVGADSAVDATSDIEATEGDQETTVSSDGCDKQASDNDANDADTPLIVATTPVSLPEELPATTFDLDAAGEAAATTAGTAISNPANAASPEEIAAAAALAATAALPAGIAADEQQDIVVPGDADTADKSVTAEASKKGVTFAATLALTDTADETAAQAEGQAQAIAARNEQQIEDAGTSFRRNTSSTRRNQGNGTGTTGTPANATHQTSAAVAAAEAHASATATTTTTAASSVAPIGFDTGLGNGTGLPGWNLHLAQGSAIRRGDFVANLRQHLQNLPAHEQVALSIQRSLRDGGGNITLQLSPAELGRIHLKLKIDEENNVQASVMVERPATLELLQRDMKALERALQEAGLKAGPGDLSFSLQGGDPEAFAREFGSGSGNGSNGSGRSGGDSADEAPAAMTAPVVDTADGWVDVQV